MRSSLSFFLEILECLCLDILDGIVLDWICPFEWEIASAEVQPGTADDPAVAVCFAFDEDIVASLREAL
jgi:hypothetical protein